MYGLKQPLRAWYDRLTSTLISFGFVQSKCDPSLLVLTTAVDIIVADIILMGSSTTLLQYSFSKLHAVFTLKQLGELDYFLGIEEKHLPEVLFFSPKLNSFVICLKRQAWLMLRVFLLLFKVA